MSRISISARRICYSMLLVLLTGCAKTPPECSAKEVSDTIRNLVLKQLWPRGTSGNDMTGFRDDYFQNLKVSLVNSASDGYDTEAKTRKCKSQLHLEAASTRLDITEQISYTLQLTEDKKSFLISVDNIQPTIGKMKLHLLGASR